MPVAVIARSLAKRLYGEGSAVGQTLSLDFTSFRVVGVVDDVSYLMDRVFSQVWYPYTQVPDFEERVRYSEARMPGLGPLKVYMLVKDKAISARCGRRWRITCVASTNRWTWMANVSSPFLGSRIAIGRVSSGIGRTWSRISWET